MSLDELSGIVKGGKAFASVKQENVRLKKQLQETTEALELARKARGLVIPESTAKRARGKTFARLIVADNHGSHANKGAIRALLDDVAAIDVREIVHLGDGLECGGWMMQSHTLGYVAQLDEVAYEEDIAAQNDFLDMLAKKCPKADIHYLAGNHEDRVERWIVDTVQGNKRNAEFLMRAIAPQNVLSLEKRGVKYYPRDGFHCGLTERGIVKLGKSYFTHSTRMGRNAASKAVDRFAGCVFYGNSHRADYSPTRMVHVGLVAAWCPGCLCELSPRWHHDNPAGWTQGYILQIVNSEDDSFHAMHVSIDNGRSYLTDLLKSIH